MHNCSCCLALFSRVVSAQTHAATRGSLVMKCSPFSAGASLIATRFNRANSGSVLGGSKDAPNGVLSTSLVSNSPGRSTFCHGERKVSCQRLQVGENRHGGSLNTWLKHRQQSSEAASSASKGGVAEALGVIKARVDAAAKTASLPPPRLVAVSKTKPVEALMEAYEAGHRDFGENYVNELVEKAPVMPPDIRWRFIGHLQSNKAKTLVSGVPNLFAVETVDSVKLADKLNTAVGATERTGPLEVFIQVDTSGEDTKSGLEAEEAVSLALHILGSCPSLKLAGLMTIGAPGDLSCFDKLVAARQLVATALGVEPSSLELSMGMSGDFEDAITRGSTNVRVGSSIFGERDYSKQK